MKKITRIALLIVIATWGGGMLILLLIMLMMGGDRGVGTPYIFASQEQAEKYQYVGSELGVPWDIVLLADAISADGKGETEIEEYNPLITSLQFCILYEQKYEKETYTDDSGKEKSRWVLIDTKEYTACDEILSYINLRQDTLLYTESSVVVKNIQDRAEEKSSDNVKYEVTLVKNPEYELVLRDYIFLEKKYVSAVMEFYDTQYLLYLYGYMQTDIDEDIQLPPITVGDVSREELAKVAASLINWPYMMGGKSSAKGQPSGPLDCSGYVDWVYIQCFGKGISSGGSLPSGVAVAGTAIQFYASKQISESELKIGDLGFLYDPATLAAGKVNHVGIYIGEINGQHAFIHCAGKYYGYDTRPTGRVGVSTQTGTNSTIATVGGSFSPAMKACNFKYFRRPNFQFTDDVEETE